VAVQEEAPAPAGKKTTNVDKPKERKEEKNGRKQEK
jgi:hypothetical protein